MPEGEPVTLVSRVEATADEAVAPVPVVAPEAAEPVGLAAEPEAEPEAPGVPL